MPFLMCFSPPLQKTPKYISPFTPLNVIADSHPLWKADITACVVFLLARWLRRFESPVSRIVNGFIEAPEFIRAPEPHPLH